MMILQMKFFPQLADQNLGHRCVMLKLFIYLLIGLMSLSTYCIGHITTGSFEGRGRSFVLVV